MTDNYIGIMTYKIIVFILFIISSINYDYRFIQIKYLIFTEHFVFINLTILNILFNTHMYKLDLNFFKLFLLMIFFFSLKFKGLCSSIILCKCYYNYKIMFLDNLIMSSFRLKKQICTDNNYSDFSGVRS